MSDVTFGEIFELAKQLAPTERLLLAMRLEKSIPETERNDIFREALIAEHEQLRAAGRFDTVESLYGKYASSGTTWEADELDAYLHHVGTEWEAEMDELTDDDPTTPDNH